MVRTLTPAQRAQAVLQTSKRANNILSQAFSDNIVLDYAGVKVSTFTAAQKGQLLELVRLYVGNLREGHAKVHMADVEKHLDNTYFAWIGETNEKISWLYYYRVHSPVILVEFQTTRLP